MLLLARAVKVACAPRGRETKSSRPDRQTGGQAAPRKDRPTKFASPRPARSKDPRTDSPGPTHRRAAVEVCSSGDGSLPRRLRR